MNTAVNEALKRCFAEKRVVFWYDEGGKCRAEFDESEVEGVEKLVIGGNEFGIKYRILAEKPDGKFLVYSPQARPDAGSDWLYDLYLAGGTFSTDPVSMTISEMGFRDDDRTRAFIQSVNPAFFKSETRKRDVRVLADAVGGANTLTVDDLVLVLVAVLCKVKDHARVDYVLAALLRELAEDKTDKLDEIAKFGLEKDFWRVVTVNYGYQAATPSVVDFANQLFHDAFAVPVLHERPVLNHVALSFFNDWKNSSKFKKDFLRLADAQAEKVHVAAQLEAVDNAAFGALDIYREIDEKILNSLLVEVERGTARVDDVAKLIGLRKDGCRFEEFKNAYQALEAATRFFAALATTDLTSVDAADAITKYSKTWFVIDQQYRLFIEHYLAAKKADPNAVDVFASLKNKVDGYYINNYLDPQSRNFQNHVNALTEWKVEGVKSQLNFWKDRVAMAGVSVCVIVSDGLRYEIAAELAQRIEATHRYSAKIEPMLGALPSYTQLGMAALLPHGALDMAGTDTGSPTEWVLSDGKSTKGIEARKALLAEANPQGNAIAYKDLMAMTKTECRAFQSSASVLYVYHNLIDARGDKRETEDETAQACREAVDEILKVIAKIGGDYRVNKFIVTSDHGFLYQDRELGPEQYVADEESIYRAQVTKNRFVLGYPLVESSVLMNFRTQDLGLDVGADVRIAKGVMRMRKAGSGVKFVHGGASLQEIVLPVVEIQHVRNRDEDVVPVEAEILVDGAGRITTNRFSVSVYQTAPVGEEFSRRKVRLSLHATDGKPLSDAVEMMLDSEAAAVPDRTKSATLTLNSAANALCAGSVELWMETGKERAGGRTDYDTYKTKPMTLRLAVQNFFD